MPSPSGEIPKAESESQKPDAWCWGGSTRKEFLLWVSHLQGGGAGLVVAAGRRGAARGSGVVVQPRHRHQHADRRQPQPRQAAPGPGPIPRLPRRRDERGDDGAAGYRAVVWPVWRVPPPPGIPASNGSKKSIKRSKPPFFRIGWENDVPGMPGIIFFTELACSCRDSVAFILVFKWRGILQSFLMHL